MGGTFDLFDSQCDGQNGLHTHFARQHNGVAGCERTIRDIRGFVSGIFYFWYWLLSKIVDNMSKLKTDSTSGFLVFVESLYI